MCLPVEPKPNLRSPRWLIGGQTPEQVISNLGGMARLLEGDELTRQVAELSGWQIADGTLRKTITFGSFADGIRCVDAVAVEAEEMNHHPDIDIRWRSISFTLSTHDAGGITQLDIELAHRIESAAAEFGGNG